MKKTVADLKQADQFKIGGQRKWRQVFKTFPAHEEGKILVVMTDCRQYVLSPTLEVEVKCV